MKYKKYLLFALSGMLFVSTANAQGKMTITYPISFPLSNTHDYISKTSFRGISVEFTQKVQPMVEVGLETGWNVFYQRADEKVYTEGTASISGVQFRYINAVPILAEGKYYLKTSNKRSKPFAGLGIGTLYVNRSTDFGLYRLTRDSWQFCLRPELGFVYNASSETAFLIGAKYYAGFGTSELDGQSYISINVGVILAL
jgi:opacity protein-like surface antigen